MDCESSDVIVAQALAREAQDKKGMDDSQITGQLAHMRESMH